MKRRKLFAALRLEPLEARELLAADISLSAGNLFITDADVGGANDQLTIQLISGSTIRISALNPLNAGLGTTQISATTVDVPIADVTGNIQVNTLDGDDTLTLDLSGGNVIVPGGLIFDGGANNDSLSIVGGATTSQTFRFTNHSDGEVVLAGAIAGVVSYLGLEPISSTVNAANVILQYSDVAEAITMTANGGQTQLDSDVGGASVSFNNPTSTLQIHGGSATDAANDIFTLNGFGAGLNAALTILGRGGADTINLNALGLTATSASLAAESITQSRGVSFSGTTTLDGGSAGVITLNNSGNTFGTVLITDAGSASLRDDGGMILGSSSIGTSLLVQSAGAITQSGPLSGPGGLVKQGAGTMTLSAANTFAGTAVVTGGTLRVAGGSAILDTTSVQVNGGTFDLNGSSETVGALFGSTGSVTLGSGTLTVSPAAATSTTLTAPISGTGSVTLNAPASAAWTLGGDNTYSGATRVVSGTLKLSGAFTNNIANSSTIELQTDSTRTLDVTNLTSGALFLASGQTLKGRGRIVGNLRTGAGSSISPGVNEGILTLSGDLTSQVNSTFVVEVNGGVPGISHDQLDVTGSVSLGSSKLATSGTITSSPGQVIVLIKNDGADAVSGTFNSPSNQPLPEGSTVTINGIPFVLSYVGGVGANDVTLTQSADWGDAPTPYPTLAAENGARHATGGALKLGATIDSEGDGTHSANADADGADEGGVTLGAIRVGDLGATVAVNVTGAAGKLDAWIDFNGDGSWGGPGEQIFASRNVVVGNNNLTFDVPSWAKEGVTYARFRLSSAGALGTEGAAADGEVEDYPVTLIPPAAGSGLFSSGHGVTISANGIYSVVAADVDGDGDMDILSASQNDDKVAWYENDGNQSYTTHLISTAANAVRSVFAADVDGDGDMDVLSASGVDHKIAWYENDGSQNFTARTITTSAPGANSVFVADVDGDGDMDVLSASQFDNKIAWYRNDGNQVFTAQTITTNAMGSLGVFAADVDGDGDMDVLSASYLDDKIAWYENDGNQVFAARTVSATADGAWSVFATDVDGDGDLDILSASRKDDKIAWYENDGNQNFTTRIISIAADGAMSVFAADLDGDGDTDALSASLSDGKTVWYENDGNQNFTAHTIISTSLNRSVFAADMDGDGDLDVLSMQSNNRIFWYENLPFPVDFGDAPAPYPTTLAENGARHNATGPILGAGRDSEVDGTHSASADADGADDNGVTFGTIRVGDLGATVAVNVTGAAGKLDAWIDFNGDGSWGGPGEQIFASRNVVVGNNNLTFDVPSWAKDGVTYARFRLSTAGALGTEGPAADGEVEDYAVTIVPPVAGSGSFSSQIIVSTAVDGAHSVFASDLDGDGDMDMLSASAVGDSIQWHENDGNANFTQHTITTAVDRPLSVFAADVDGDGDLDVIGTSYYLNKISWYENDGNQHFTQRELVSSTLKPTSIIAADLDGDGDTDLLSSSRSDQRIVWYDNDGNQNFTERTIGANVLRPLAVYAADVDGDGDLDVLSASHQDDKIAWYENDGNQNFLEHAITTTADGAESVFATDMDGDGDMDVLSASFYDDTIAWYENDGNQSFTPHTIGTPNGANHVFAADVDGDGDTDVLSSSLFNDRIIWFENRGSQNFASRVLTTSADGPYSVFAADVDGDGDLDVLSASLLDDKIAWYRQNNKPTVDQNSLTIAEGATVVLSDGDLNASDTDNTDAQLTFTASSVSGGQFEMVGNPGAAITTFTQADINAGNVRFVHNGGETAPAFTLVVSDGTVSSSPPTTAGVTFTNINDQAPVFTSNATLTLAENGTSVGNVTATDPDLPAQTVTYSITGGADAAKFTITPSGALSFVTAPDFEAPTDVGGNNIYEVQITANDGNGLWSEQVFTINVLDLLEGGVRISGTAGNDTVTVLYSPADVTVLMSANGGPTSSVGTYPLGTALTVEGLGGTDQLSLALTPDQLDDFTTADILVLQNYLPAPTGKTLYLLVPSDINLATVNFESATLSVNDDDTVSNVTACFQGIASDARILVGTASADVIYGTSATDLIFGQGGDDTVYGLDGSDCLYGGDGHDLIFGGSMSDLLVGGSGDDSLIDDLGFDRLIGGLGADWLEGGLHDDQLDGGPGQDTILGGPGYDLIKVRLDEAATDVMNGGENTDTIMNDMAAPVVLAGFDASVSSVEGWSGNNQPILGTDAANLLSFLVGPSYSMSLTGVPYIDGRGGNDTITGTNGVDNLRGGEGNDTLYGMGGADTMYGDAGDDSLNGGDAVDALYGGDGVDTITTGAGRDIVDFADDVSSLDTITDFALYSDTINLQAYATSYSQLTFSIVAPHTTINLANGKKIRLLNWSRVVSSGQFRF